MPKVRFYAVRRGREGKKIYDTWDECRENTQRYPGAEHRSFPEYEQAAKYIEEGIATRSTSVRIAHQGDKQYIDLTEDDDLYEFDTEMAPSTSSFRVPGAYDDPIDLTASDEEMYDCYEALQTLNRNTIETKNEAMKQANVIEIEDDPPIVALSPITLSPEQQMVLDKVKRGESVFFTGSAGTGKSVLLRAIIDAKGGQPSNRLGITASTGIASVNIGGTTLHSWAGIGLGVESAKDLVKKIIFHRPLRPVLHRWKTTETLIIDEVSMIDGELFEKLEFVARKVREKEIPFGGIQLILSGDFCQLPPVPGRTPAGVEMQARFAFEAECWDSCVGDPVTLVRVFRQKDQAFVDMLNEMRFGKVRPETEAIFKGLAREVHYTDGIEPTELFALRKEVEYANQTRLKKLKGEMHTYHALDIPGKDSKDNPVSREQMKKLLNRLVVQESLSLRIGAQVMLIKNLVQGELVNGSVGKVIAFSTPEEAKKNHTQIAISDDPSQQGPSHPPDSRIGKGLWPLVKFMTGQEVLCVPATFTVNNASGEMESLREQVPLILAWALSVHKSQGQTLERVKVNLRSTFEKGQAYVALSRATKLETLQVLNFDAAKVMAHPRVLEWMGVTRDDSHNTGNHGVVHSVIPASQVYKVESDDTFDEMDGEEAQAAYYYDSS